MFIMLGLVRISVSDGRRLVVVGYAKEGGYFGDFEYHKRSTRVARYTAVYGCNLLAISQRSLDEAIENNIDAGLNFKKELLRRFELFLSTHKTRTVAMDIGRKNMSLTKIRELGLLADQRNTVVSKPTPEGATTEKRDTTGGNMLKSIVNARLVTKLLSSKAKRSVVVTAHDSSSCSSSDEDFDPMAVKVIGDPNTPKILMKRQLFVDGRLIMNNGFSATLETTISSSENERPFRVLKEDTSKRDPVTGSFEKIVTEETSTQLSKRGIIFHKSPWKQRWDTFIGILIVYNVLVIPVQMGLDWTMGLGIVVLDTISDIVFTIDIPMAFRTSYFDEDEDAVVSVPSMCNYKYFTTWFFIDAFAQVPFFMTLLQVFQIINKKQQEQLNSFSLIRIVRMLRLLKVARLAKLGRYISKLEDSLGVNPITFDLLKMMLEVIFIGHMLACTWWAVHNMTEDNWTERLGDNDLDPIDEGDYTAKYVISLYWAFTTLATVVYGDIVPTNMTHRIVVILIMVLGATVFGYIVANVSTLMSDLDQTSARVSERISEITEFLTEKNCPRNLSNSIIRHFRHMFSQTSAFDEPGILNRLPNRIIRSILLTQHQSKIKKIALFNFVDNESVVLFIFRMMTPTYFEEYQAMVKEGEIGENVMFIVQGKARVYKAMSAEELIKARLDLAKKRKEAEILEAQTREINAKNRRKSVSMSNVIRKSSMGSMGLARGAPVESDKTSAQQDRDVESNLTEPLGIVGEGDFVGHVALIYGTRHAATVRAETSLAAYCLSRSDFQRIVRDHPGVALVMQMALGEAVHALHRDIGKAYSREARFDFLSELKGTFSAQKAAKDKAIRLSRQASKNESSIHFLSRGEGSSSTSFLGWSPKRNNKTTTPTPGTPYTPPRGTGTDLDDSTSLPVKDVSAAGTPTGSPTVRVVQMKQARAIKVEGGDKSVQGDVSDSSNEQRTPVLGGLEAMKARLGNSMSSMRGFSFTGLRPSRSNDYATSDASEMNTHVPRALLPFDHPTRKAARKRWGLIRQAMQDARVTATVASMNHQRQLDANAGKGKSRSRWRGKSAKEKMQEEEDHKINMERRMSAFARAMQSKVGHKLGMTLMESNMNYDSDSEIDKDILTIMGTQAKKTKYRVAEDIPDWIDDTRPPKRATNRLHRRQSWPSRGEIEWKEDTRDLFVA